MDNLKIRCSSLGKIMGSAKSKDEFDLSVGAKTYIRGLVKEIVFDYHTEISSKYLDKGNMVEDESILLLNDVLFSNHFKNEESKSNEYITGTCDIKDEMSIIDVKSSWSAETFPSTPDEAVNKDYEWQLRGYMMLYDRHFSKLAYCLVDTPDSLLEWENNLSIHHVNHIAPELRVTILDFERDAELEDLIIYKVKECRKYASWYEQQILNKNK